MNILFGSNQLSLRGTEIAMYSYADYCEKLLGHRSIIVSKNPNIQPFTHPLGIKKFQERFKDRVYFYDDFHKDIYKIADKEKIDVGYFIKAGMNDGIFLHDRKSVIHAVFQFYDPHADRYCMVSEWLAGLYGARFVPHMIDLPDVDGDLREELGIPKDAIVMGRYGGQETFDVSIAHSAIQDVVSKRDDIYFIFMYTNKFCSDHKQIIHLDGCENMEYKTKFINTCDSMISARKKGESFGLSNLEFSSKNVPNIVYKSDEVIDRAHFQMLGDKAIYYSDYGELCNIINNFKPDKIKDWNAAGEYTPEKVMQIFKKEFLD